MEKTTKDNLQCNRKIDEQFKGKCDLRERIVCGVSDLHEEQCLFTSDSGWPVFAGRALVLWKDGFPVRTQLAQIKDSDLSSHRLFHQRF